MTNQDRPTTIRPGEELPLAPLERYLHQTFPDLHGPLTVAQYPAGHSNLTYALTVGATSFVLRRPPFGSKVKSAHDMSREFRVLGKLHAAFPPAPEVLAYSEDDAILGTPFYLMRPIEGVILRARLPPGLPFPPATAATLSHSFIDTLVALHQVDYAAAGLADLGRPEGYLQRQLTGWTARYHAAKTHDYTELPPLLRYLETDIPQTRKVSLLHNDFKYDNCILSADLMQIIGLLDWEMCTIGDSLADLGTALAYWTDITDPPAFQAQPWGPTNLPGSFTREQLVHAYATQTGTDCSRIIWYTTLARFKLAVILQQIYYRFHQGLTQDKRFAQMNHLVATLLTHTLTKAQTQTI